MRIVETTSSHSIRHRVTFDDAGTAIRVDTLVRNTNGNSEFWTRKLWQSGDQKMSIAAHCAINRALAQPAETPMERSTGNRKYLREEDCEDNDEGA